MRRFRACDKPPLDFLPLFTLFSLSRALGESVCNLARQHGAAAVVAQAGRRVAPASKLHDGGQRHVHVEGIGGRA